jgi:hypothetical protein
MIEFTSSGMTNRAVRTFSPGFRLSVLDGAILAGGGLTTYLLYGLDRWTGVAAAFVVVHFFLFCNVLRMSRKPELTWAAVFAALAVSAAVFRIVSWPVVLSVSAVLTVLLTVLESRRPSYHGVGWQRLNPQLPAWWSARETGGG